MGSAGHRGGGWAVGLTAAAAVLVGTTATAARAGSSASPHSPRPAVPDRTFDRDISATPDWRGGEPEVAVNPRNPDNVVMVWPEENATGAYRNPLTGVFDVATGTAVGYANDPGFSRCGLAVSWDGGLTWTRSVLPAQTAQSTLCSDAAVAAGPDGTFYAAVITFHVPTTPLPGVAPGTLPPETSMDPGQGAADAVITSTDGGRTWTYPPVDAIGNRGTAARRYAPGSSPETGGEGTVDRPWIVADASDGTVYLTGLSDVIMFNGTARTESWVTASTDHGRSFGTVYPVDDAAFPQAGAASIAATHGTLAVAYIGQHPSGSSDLVVLATSRDDGRSFSRRVLEAPVSAGGVIGVNLAADPSRPGRYYVMVPTSGESGVLVFRTDDYGVTWTSPVKVGVGTSRPWLAVSPGGGVVGVMGRDEHSDGSQDVTAAFSYDHGASFGPGLLLNDARTPPPPPGTITLYDDVSWLLLTDTHAFAAWGDWRRSPVDPNGETNAWMARVPVTKGAGASP